MNIFFWTDGFHPRLGGVETQGFEFVRGLQQRGHRCIVLAQRDRPDWPESEVYEGIAIQRFDFNAIVSKRDLTIIRSIREYLAWVKSEFRPDILHLNTGIGGSGLGYLLFRELFSIPTVLTAHVPYIEPNVQKIIHFVDVIGCVSGWVKNSLATAFPSYKDKLKLVYNGLSNPQITSLPLSFSPPILLAFGRLVKEKGFDVAIDAFALLKKKGSSAQLIIAGGGPERAALEKKSEALGLKDSIQFTGILTEEKVIAYFLKATLVIVPSLIESFGLVILEAMQLGRPVIASRVEGVPEVVSEGETALLVPPQDSMALCNAIETLLNNPEEMKRMGERGRKRAMEQFTIEQNVIGYEKIYEDFVLG